MRDPHWHLNARSAADVIALVRSGDRVFIHGAAATPTPLLDALAARRDLEGVNLYHLHLAGPATFLDNPGLRSNSLFAGPNVRKAIDEGRAEFIPIFLSDIPHVFRDGLIPLDVAIVQVSPPDAHGNCTLGTSVDTAKSAVESARIVLAEINDQMPRTHGNTALPLSRITAFVKTDRPLHEAPPAPQTEIEAAIGDLIAGLIEDGSTLQMGIGAIPDAVLSRLGDKHELGIHTEMFSDGLIPLIEGGVVTNRQKEVHAGRTVTSFVSGTRRLFDFVHDNLGIEFHPCDRTNDTALIRKNPRVVAINACLEVDLSGQVCADSLGFRVFSGIGGQMDFIRAATLSRGGKAILALPSTASNGALSRIVPALKEGAGVVTTRGHVHWLVTEHGAVNLHGLTLRQRAERLIAIAHPDFRTELRTAIAERRHFVFG
ncbi:MAG: acetyl-CoA hydrolase/transferase family protein [Deltaproteobacteria bacterium]|nr:acetyl-CoA hydrolase/transferase family protein [Deltaproteobacteria bacterium]